jgi:hypothetical protein
MITSNSKPAFPGRGCIDWGQPGQGGYHLRHLIAALDRMNGHPAGADVQCNTSVTEKGQRHERPSRQRGESPRAGLA